jgi:hypothetical protein
MAGRFKHEEFSRVLPGEKVRTVTKDGHRVRIAFPRGPRRTGSGRLIEVLHPVQDNPCRLPNPTELVVMMANPTPAFQCPHCGESFTPAQVESGAYRKHLAAHRAARSKKKNPNGLADASETYQQFHGEPGEHVDEIHEPSPRPLSLAQLGEMIELQVRRSAGWKWGSLDLKGRGIRLAFNPEGSQLYFVGGDQKVSRGELSTLGVDNRKDLIDLGEAMLIAYRARKAQVDGQASDYEHFFGEETGVRPRLGYDRRGSAPRLFLSGGAYYVTAEGIRN